MATTNTNVAAEIYSKRFLAGLTTQLAPLRQFSTDFSPEAKQVGDTVRVPLISADSAAAWDDTSNNFSGTAEDLTDREVVVDDRRIAKFTITPAQMANFHPNWWEGKADLNVMEVADAVLDQVAALVTGDNYGDTAADKMTVSLAGFGRKSVAAIRAKAIKDKKLRMNRSVLALNPEFFSALLGDLDANVYGGREAMVTGVIPGLLGFRSIIEIPQLTGPGFVCHPDAIAIAARKIAFLSTKPYEKVQDVVEPETGLLMTNVIYVDGSTGHGTFSVNVLFGEEVGRSDTLMRLI